MIGGPMNDLQLLAPRSARYHRRVRRWPGVGRGLPEALPVPSDCCATRMKPRTSSERMSGICARMSFVIPVPTRRSRGAPPRHRPGSDYRTTRAGLARRPGRRVEHPSRPGYERRSRRRFPMVTPETDEKHAPPIQTSASDRHVAFGYMIGGPGPRLQASVATGAGRGRSRRLPILWVTQGDAGHPARSSRKLPIRRRAICASKMSGTP